MAQTCITYTGLSALPSNPTPTICYVPFQIDACIYEECEALSNGTLFPSLDKPFLRGSECCD